MGCSASTSNNPTRDLGKNRDDAGKSNMLTGSKNKNKTNLTPRRSEDAEAKLIEEGTKGLLDSRLPLNRRQLFLLGKSWKAISRNMDIVGVKLFTGLFLSNPELLVLFKNIQVDKDKVGDREAYENSLELETHSEIVMNTLDEAISTIIDYDKCHQILTSIGAYHCTIKGFLPEYFLRTEEPFLEAVKEVLGDRYNANIENIYRIGLHFILTTLQQGCQSGIEQQQQKSQNTLDVPPN